MEHNSNSTEETQKIAADFAHTLVGGDVILLKGDLGAGKTTFTQGLMQAFGYKDPVRSPTFSMVNLHAVNRGEIEQVAHIDLFRLKSPDELKQLALEDYIGYPSIVTIIEWPNTQIEEMIKASYYSIKFERVSEDSRKITINEYETTKR